MNKVVIIGNGVSGVTAARHVRKRDSTAQILIISSESDYFFSRTALMYVYMGHMKFDQTQPYETSFWKENNIDLKKTHIVSIDYNKQLLVSIDEEEISYDTLVLAVGSKPNKFDWKGVDSLGVQGLYSYQDLQLLEKNSKDTKHAVIVGGGLIGVELAEMLTSRGIGVTFLVRDKLFWNGVLPKQEATLITNHIIEHGVDLRLEDELMEIVSDTNGRVKHVITKKGDVINCQIVGLTAGVRPNIEFLRNSTLEVAKGVLVNEYLETNISNVYAIGDCAEFKVPVNQRKSIEQVWYTGKMMGETVAKTITGNKTSYNPGHWFNSAKFFDIEYQTYGRVSPNLRSNEDDFYWEHEKGKIAVHFVFESESRKLIGVNSFGIRLRHHAFDTWLNELRSIDYVLEHLADANFDPEFYKQYESNIVSKFNHEKKGTIKLKKKNWDRILNFIK